MSGKPVPSFSFAVEASYPSGPNPWNATPTKVLPVPDYFLPNVKPPAQWFNYLFNLVGTTITANFNWTGNMAAQNWYPQQAGLGTSGQIGIAWDQYLSKWLLLTSTGVNTELFVGYGMDGNTAADWTLLNSLVLPLATSAAICTDPATVGDYYFAYVNDDGTHNGTVQVQHYNGSSWSTTTTVVVSSSTTQIQKPRLFRTGLLTDPVLAIGNNTGTHGSGVNPIVYAISGSGVAIDPGFPANDWAAATSGSVFVIVPTMTSFSLTAGGYLTSTTGSSFTSRTMSFLGSNDMVTGICWTLDATAIAAGQSGCFLISVYNTGTTKTRFYRSADGVTWSASGAPNTTLLEVVDLAALGALVVGTLADASSGGPSGQAWSPDGGATWYFSQATFTSNVVNTASNYERSRVVAGSQGFMAMNVNWFRFSLMQGVPAATL